MALFLEIDYGSELIWHYCLQTDAKQKYIQLVDQLIGADTVVSSSNQSSGGHVIAEQTGKIFSIKLNRPEKKNALTTDVSTVR